MIFQNVQLLDYVGMFGNANPHFIEDWVQANLDNSKDKSDITGVWEGNTCTFPSAYHLQIFYSKINTLKKPQYKILQVKYYADTQK